MYELYFLLGLDEEEATKRIEVLTKEKVNLQNYVKPSSSLTLESLMFPEHPLMLKLSPYDRYLALLVQKEGMAATAARVHMSRMTLYRYVEELKQKHLDRYQES